MSREADAVRSMRTANRVKHLRQAAARRERPTIGGRPSPEFVALCIAGDEAWWRAYLSADRCVESFGYFSHHNRATRDVLCRHSYRVARFARWMRDHRRNPNARGAKR